MDVFARPIQDCKNFAAEGRCVTWLYSSGATDVLLVCWERNQSSSYHDHGPSESIVYVVEGYLTVFAGDEQRRYGAGTVAITPRGVKHRLVNAEPGRLVTLHVYAPGLVTPVSQPLVDLRTHEEKSAV